MFGAIVMTGGSILLDPLRARSRGAGAADAGPAA
jgi:hypothetical protein